MWGIGGWDPSPLTATADVIAGHGDRLADLTGRCVARVWGQRFAVDGDWSRTGPLVLDLGGPRLEIAVEGFNRLYLSWNDIDMAEPLDGEEQDDPDLALEWGELELPELQRVIAVPVRAVRILEGEFHFSPVDDGAFDTWLLSGLELLFEGDAPALQIFNGLNEIALANDAADADAWRRHDSV